MASHHIKEPGNDSREPVDTWVQEWMQYMTHSRTQSQSYARSTERDKGLWPNPYQTGI